jgi:hypothetical protein
LISPARCHDRAGGESNDAADDGGRKAKLDDGKRSSQHIDPDANDEPNDCPGHADRDRADHAPPHWQATQIHRARVHSIILAAAPLTWAARMPIPCGQLIDFPRLAVAAPVAES